MGRPWMAIEPVGPGSRIGMRQQNRQFAGNLDALPKQRAQVLALRR